MGGLFSVDAEAPIGRLADPGWSCLGIVKFLETAGEGLLEEKFFWESEFFLIEDDRQAVVLERPGNSPTTLPSNL